MKVEICSVALMCLTLVLALLVPLSEKGPIAGETVAANNEWIHLTPGSTTRRELKAGGKDVFGIDVDAGKLIRFSIDKGDLGLSTVLYGPTGTKLLEHISQDFETVEIFFPADSAGLYRIELQSRENVQLPRPYELTLQPLRSATSQDRKDSEARRAIAAAEVLRANWAEASLRQASEHYDEAASMWTALQDFSSAARATLKSGDVQFLLSNYPKASERYQKAASLAATAGDRVTQATALSQSGRVYCNRGDNVSAEQYIEKALDLLQPHDAGSTAIVRNATGVVLSALGEVIYAKGNLPKASEQFQRALELLDGDRKNQANVHMFIAYIAGANQPEKARSEISQALTLYQATNNKSGEGLALIGLGLYHSSNRKEFPAVTYHRQAIDIFRAVGDRLSHAIALNAVGQVYENLFRYDVALDNYEHALRLFQEIDALDMATMAMLKVGTIHRRRKEFDRAHDYYERCRALSLSAGKLRTEAAAINEIAGLYADQGKFDEAARQYRQVLKIYEGIDDSRGEAIALNDYGDFLLSNHRTKEALAVYQHALHLSEQVDKGIITATIYNLANAHRLLGDFQTALSLIQQSLKILNDVRSDVGSPDSRASFVSGVWKHYELCIDILMQLDREHPGEGHAVDAFLLNDKNRAGLMLDLLAEAQADRHEGAIGKLQDRERELRGYLTSLARYEMELSLNKKGSAELVEVNTQIAQLSSEYQEVQAQLREHMPNRASLDRFTPNGLDQVQNELRNTDTLLLDFDLGDERSYLWAVTATSFHSYELPPRKIIEDAATELYKFGIARQEQNDDASTPPLDVAASDHLFDEKAIGLSNMLFGPIAQELGNKKLLIVAEGALQYVPFEALPVPGTQTRLINTNEIDRTPSLSTLVAIRAENKRVASPDKIAAVIADPVFSKSDERVQSGGLSEGIASTAKGQNSSESAEQDVRNLRGGKVPQRLTHAAEEADAILAAAPRGTTMIAKGFDATYETATNPSVGQYQIVHFATHGFFDREHPELSGIVLTMVDRNGFEKNGLMPLHDIYNLNLSAELTVLSACQTALGKDMSGEGLVGLTHSFISAGSKSVVASLWKVDDRATTALMTEFYKALLQDGMTTGAALRTAKLKMMQDKRWSAPYYWAGFILQGEYNNHINVKRHTWFVPVVLLLSVVLISSGVIFVQRRRRRSFAARRL